jgi:hypothetical protein
MLNRPLPLWFQMAMSVQLHVTVREMILLDIADLFSCRQNPSEYTLIEEH